MVIAEGEGERDRVRSRKASVDLQFFFSQVKCTKILFTKVTKKKKKMSDFHTKRRARFLLVGFVGWLVSDAI